ncbi:MAG TPA: PIG-L deacetylase family protein [Candidatus Limnocylindria bacterium]|nr:PIG-L deacetylase family protein [Candidatus Limnocylindria bacterium]
MTTRPDDRIGGLAAIFAHPDDESFTAAGALALAHDAGRTVRLLLLTRGEAGNAERTPDLDLADTREEEMRCAAAKIGMDEVTVADHPDGHLTEVSFSTLVDEIAAWLGDRRPDAVITFGAHGVTNDADHVVVGAATRWAVERLAEAGIAPHAVYVVAPVFGPGQRRYDLSPEEGAATHRIEITDVAARKLAALACHASQEDTAEEIAELRAALDRDGVVYEGYTRVRPTVPAARPTFFSRL